MEDENSIREKKILGILRKEIEDGEDLAAEARKMVGYLLVEKKRYLEEEVRRDVVFEVKLGEETAYSVVDFVVSIEGRKAMIIKCAAGSLDSRQRQAVAAARVIAALPVPVAVVADPETAQVLDVLNGKMVGEGFGAIPVRDQLLKTLSSAKLTALPPEKLEREKRILLAFDAIRCSVPQGGDGGVSLDDVCEE